MKLLFKDPIQHQIPTEVFLSNSYLNPMEMSTLNCGDVIFELNSFCTAPLSLDSNVKIIST